MAENGLAVETGCAAIWKVELGSGAYRLSTTGRRDPNGMGWAHDTGAQWTVVHEHDAHGSDLVPECLPSVRDSAFCG